MQRKIIQQSATSIGISLPSKWVKKWRLKKGEPLNVDEDNETLTIKPVHFKAPEKKTIIDAHAYGKLVRRKFDNLSKQGYDEIKVLYQDDKELQPIIETLQVEATMFEIIKKEKDYIIVKAISEINKEEFENLLNRLIFLLKEKLNKVKEYLENENEQLLEDIILLEKTNNKLSHMCMRALHKHLIAEEAYIKYTFIWNIEKLGNDFKFFAQRKPKKIDKETKKIFLDVLDSIGLICDLFFKYDSKKALFFYQKRKEIIEACDKLIKSCKDPFILHIALSMVEKGLYLLGLIFALKHAMEE